MTLEMVNRDLQLGYEKVTLNHLGRGFWFEVFVAGAKHTPKKAHLSSAYFIMKEKNGC